MPVVMEEMNSTAHRGNDQILVSVVVNVSESGAHTDQAGQGDAGLRGDVFKFAAAQIFPK